MQVKDLTGVALDWAVAKCEGKAKKDLPWKTVERWQYSTDWSQAGPIIERKRIDIMWCGDRWCAYATVPNGEVWVLEGTTPLVAAMRAYVAGKVGETIEVPAELI